MSDHVTIVEMAPRDGLLNEQTHVPTDAKIALVDHLSACGFTRIEVASFVSPKWVPQMADAAQVMAGITRAKGVRYTALDRRTAALGAAVAVNASLPTATVDAPLGTGGLGWEIEGIVDKEFGNLLLAANLGHRGQPEVLLELLGTRVGHRCVENPRGAVQEDAGRIALGVACDFLAVSETITTNVDVFNFKVVCWDEEDGCLGHERNRRAELEARDPGGEGAIVGVVE